MNSRRRVTGLVLVAAFACGSTAGAQTASPGPVSERADWRDKMRPILPLGYLAHHTATPLVIDGKLDDAAWASAPWTSDFVDIQGDARPRPRHRTRAKLLWDDIYLYVAAELEEPHLWGTLLDHDAVIFRDPDFEVFIDPDGDTHAYYEFEINTLNTGWDLQLVKPYQDGGPARNEWEIPGLKTAVHLDGTLNDSRDRDRRWFVELAFPWTAFADRPGHPQPPAEGAQWRLNFSRVQWRIMLAGQAYKKVPDTPEDNWVWSPQGVVDMHRPEMWGLLQFTRTPAARDAAAPDAGVVPLPGKAARDVALEVYYAQRDFFKTHSRWATSLDELGSTAPAATAPRPVLASGPEGWTCEVAFEENGMARRWRVRQDRLLSLVPVSAGPVSSR